LSPEDVRLHRLCDEALFYIWDPIGVHDAPEARDEYQAYVPQVVTLVKAGSREELIDHLNTVMGMGLVPDGKRAEDTADFLLGGRDWIARTSAS